MVMLYGKAMKVCLFWILYVPITLSLCIIAILYITLAVVMDMFESYINGVVRFKKWCYNE